MQTAMLCLSYHTKQLLRQYPDYIFSYTTLSKRLDFLHSLFSLPERKTYKNTYHLYYVIQIDTDFYLPYYFSSDNQLLSSNAYLPFGYT